MTYIAKYITEEAHNKACDEYGEHWVHYVECGYVEGDDLKNVVLEAASKDMNNEAYGIREITNKNGFEEVIGSFLFYDLMEEWGIPIT